MAIRRTDIEKALDELISDEGGTRFQRLAVVLGKNRWPELIAHPPKKDLGLDAYAPASETPEKLGKGLAASLTTNLNKISADAKTAKEHYPDLKKLLFVTAGKVTKLTQKKWETAIQKEHGLELLIIEREEIITQMVVPANAKLAGIFLHLDIDSEPQVVDLIARIKRAAAAVAQTWARRTKGRPLVDLTSVRLDPNGAESAEVLSLEQINEVLSQSCRIVLEGPAGRGKTTTLIQLAQHARTAGTPFMVDLPAWTSSRRGILEYIAGMSSFQAEGLTATDLARVQKTEPFLLLLNGWNEIAESNSAQANDALRELERDFPSAGIIVATRTHHLTPPLPGGLRLRLLYLRRVQRAAYLDARLGAEGAELRARIDADPSLDELTRTPFTLSEVTSLFEAGAEIPSTKIGILAQVVRLQEQRDEHRNALEGAPIFGRQVDYLKTLATEMTARGAVALPEVDARTLVAVVARGLAKSGQIEPVGAPAVLATLTAHHVLELVDYPQIAFRFEHQQLQEYFAALDIHEELFDLRDEDHDATGRFTADYVNDPAWEEPLRMIAETIAEQSGDGGAGRGTRAGAKLVKMALAVDLVFAGELAQLCGSHVWNEVRAVVGERFRAVYAVRDGIFRQYALAAMLATGADAFSDIIVPLLSKNDQHTRLGTYRLWPDFRVSSIGPNWREQLRGWSDEARADFVSELLHHRIDGEVVDFAVQDNSMAVKKAAASGLMWTRSNDALTRVLESMDVQTFEDVARTNADEIPTPLRSKTVAAMHTFIKTSTDNPARLRTALKLVEFGETCMDGVIKDAMAALAGGGMRNLDSHYIQPTLEHLHKTDPAWTSEWVAIQIAEGTLYGHEHWLPFVTAIPDAVVEKILQRLKTEDLRNARFEGMVAVIAARADEKLAARVFAEQRDLRRKVDAEPGQRHDVEWQVMRQLEALFHRLPDDVAVAGIISSNSGSDPLDIKVAARLLSRVARSDVEPLCVADNDLRARLRAYLKGSVDLVLSQDDFNGEEKANLASSIAQVGEPEDVADLLTLISADIERMRRGRAARAAGDLGPLGNGALMSYGNWHIAAVMHLDPAGAEQVLIDLLPEPEYRTDAAAAMAREYLPKPERSFDPAIRYDLMWTAREGATLPSGNDPKRTRFAAALKAEIKRLRQQIEDGESAAGLKELATALAAIDGRGSAEPVLEVISMPDRWNKYTCLSAAERLLMAGVVLPASAAFALADSVLDQTKKWMQDSDCDLLSRILALCPFVNDPVAGIAKVSDVLRKRTLRGYRLRELVTALGESRSDAATDLLYELATDALTFEQCEENLINAVAAIDTPHAGELLLGFIDPDIRGIALTRRLDREDVLVARLTELAQHRPEAAARLRQLCERDLPELNRQVLSRVMDWLGTPEARAANLNLIDDAKPSPVPRGIRDQLESAFIERRPYGQNPNVFSEHARASNELRVRLFRMVIQDPKRRKSAFMLLGKIEEWRLEHGRPTGEPRHPDFASGQIWPPADL